MLSRKHIAYSLLIGTTVIVALLLALPYFISSESLRAKLLATIQEQTGGQVYYQQAELSLLPRLSITINQVEIDFADQVQGRVASIQVCPDFWPLLTGQIRLGRLVLDSPEIDLNLPQADSDEDQQATTVPLEGLKSQLDQSLESLTSFAPDLTLLIENGSLALRKGNTAFSTIKGLSLKLSLKVAATNSAQVDLKSSTSALTLHHNGQDVIIQGLTMDAGARRVGDKLSLSLGKLSLAQPALQINGTADVTSTSSTFSIDLNGTGIDVDATRAIALTLAGDTTPVQEIFDYLRGGTIPQISFHTQGETVSELGDLKNILLKGHLQSGSVSIPTIKLDLAEVTGDVVLSEGILHATDVTTRLQDSIGHDGTLKVSLTEDNDLFQMELMLSADLAQAQKIVQQIVDNPDLSQEMNKVTKLKGHSTGKLILGDSLTDIKVRIESSELNLTAEYQGLLFPLNITSGQFAFTEGHLGLRGLTGSVGKSEFSEVVCDLSGEETLHLDLSSGQFGLVLDELYPWVSSLDSIKNSLREIKQLTGHLDLSSLSIKGDVGKPEQLQIAATGAFRNINIATPHFPETISLSEGDFTLGSERLTIQRLKARSLDADISVSGTLLGLTQGLDSVELALDGKLGQKTMAWVKDTLEMPETYSLRTPMTFSATTVTWKADATTTFKGKVSIDKGPNLTLDISHNPESLQINRLNIKDRHSDAEVSFGHKPEGFSLKFAGNLQHETLEALFVDLPFGEGQLEGDFNVLSAVSEKGLPVAKGHLTGKNLSIPISLEDSISIKKISLVAEGAKVNAEAAELTWQGFTWNPVNTTINFLHDKIDINLSTAKLCGIDTSGILSIGKELALDLTLEGNELDVSTSFTCLTEGQTKMTGLLDFSSKISAQGEAGALINTIQGPLEMNFRDGSVEQSKMLARTLALLNVTEVVKGKLPDLESSSLKYSTITLQGNFQGEKLILDTVHMDGDTLGLIGNGEIDFNQKTIDADILASPFKTVDSVVKFIPGINSLLGGTLVAIPISVSGSQANPQVQIMSASSVGSTLLDIGGRILNSPIKLIETVTPE